MTVRRILAAAAVLVSLLLGAGCGDREGAALPAETDESYYIQGVQLKKQGRNPEALNAFLKVIEKRGERAAAESHLEAALIYLDQIKDPVEAYHHFRKYLELRPNSKEAPFVRGKVDEAKRELARSLPGRPLDDQSVRLQADEEISKLRRDNEELRAELAVLRGGGAMPVSRTPRMINVPNEPRSAIALPTAPVNDAPIIPAPPRPASTEPPMIQPVLPAPTRVTVPAAKPTATNQIAAKAGPAKSTPTKNGPAGNRTHTVAQSDSLWKIARQYYGSNASAAQVRGIVDANRGVISSETSPLKPGMVLKIP